MSFTEEAKRKALRELIVRDLSERWKEKRENDGTESGKPVYIKRLDDESDADERERRLN